MSKNNIECKFYNGIENIEMNVDFENLHSVMNLLRNNIYSEPLDSWIREQWSNAVDAHSKANNTTDPIEVSLIKDTKNHFFVLRDYGNSMTKEVIHKVYSVMGKTTKSKNDNQLGSWGLGCKSSLSYSNHFFIETWVVEDSKKYYRRWVQYIDSTEVGAMSLLEERLDDFEKSGTQITVPYKSRDHYYVKLYTSKYLSYTKNKYKINFDTELFQNNIYDYYGDNWALSLKYDKYQYKIRNDRARNIILVGSIPYELNLQDKQTEIINYSKQIFLEKDLGIISNKENIIEVYSQFIKNLEYIDFRLELPIDHLDLNACRESIQFTKKSYRNLSNSLINMFLDFYKHILIDVVHNLNYRKACLNYINKYGLLTKTLIWHKENIIVTKHFNIFKEVDNPLLLELKLEFISYWNQNNNKLKCCRSQTNTFSITNNYLFIIQDSKYKNYIKFIKEYLLKTYDKPQKIKVIVIEPIHKNKIHDWIYKEYGVKSLVEIIAFLKKDNSSQTNLKNNKAEIKVLSLYNYKIRSRATGLKAYFDYKSIPKNPIDKYYYLSSKYFEEDSEDYIWKSTDSNKDYFDFNSNKLHILIKKYLLYKNIDPKNLIYLPKPTKTQLKNDNWVDVYELIKTDYEDSKKFLQPTLDNLYRIGFIKNVAKIFEYLDIHSEIKDTLFFKLRTKYIDSQLAFNRLDKLSYNVLSLLNEDIRKFYIWSTNNIYRTNILELFKNKKEYYSIQKEYLDYLEKLPLLKFHNRASKDSPYYEYIKIYEKIKKLK